MQQLRNQRISSEIDLLQQQPALMLTQCQPDGLIKQDFWIVWIKGRAGSTWQGSVIPVQITFPEDYPIKSPHIAFPSDFQHIHVYPGGQICLPILESQYWKPKSQMIELLRRIESLIHQEINPYSPANSELYALYKSDRQNYEQKMKQQKLKYCSKDSKYYAVACLHIDFV